ncbi:MAG: TauD/TfdA dioxygenase family protein [Rhodospirillales bacterium]|jgi:taurine dioxygenase
MNVIAKEPELTIDKLSDNVGVEVRGIDLRQPVSEAMRLRLNTLLEDNIALCIRDQEFTAADYLAAGQLFGEVMEDQNRRYLADGVPLVSTLSNRNLNSEGKQAKVATSAKWHTDHTNQEFPPKFTSLYPIELPDQGGGTSLCNARAGYEALPNDLKQKITVMKTVNQLVGRAVDHSNPDIIREQVEKNIKQVVQPLVRTHPVNGSKAVWFHPTKLDHIIGMSPEDSQEFIADLTVKLTKPEFTYVHQWKLGDMLIWDNRSALHKAGFDYDHSQHRYLYRLLVRGDRPF